MDMGKYGAAPVRPEDVRDGPRQEKILDVSINEKYDVPVLHFAGGDTFMLNNTNTRAMNRAYGTESDGWLGQVVELAIGSYTDYRGEKPEERETVTLRAVTTRQPSADNGGAKGAVALRDELNEEIPF